jgi:prepilin peptidase CpaA
MEPSTWILISLVSGFVLTAAITDLAARRIPNWLTVSALVLALIFHTLTSGWSGLGFSLGGFATGFSILLVLWLIGGGGGGDVKLMGALGSWLGAKGILYVFLCSSVFACAAAVALLITRVVNGTLAGRLIPVPAGQGSTRRPIQEVPDIRHTAGHRWAIPYALPVAAGTLCVLLYQYLLLPRM